MGGLDLDQFVHPERISSQLICPICTQVLDRPVQTATEHLFCEDELLEWMTRSDLCPITKTKLDPSQIRKPGRIVLNMLAELEMYCKNRPHGCTWTGSREHLLKHQELCTCRSKEELLQELKEKDDKLSMLSDRVDNLTNRNMSLEEENIVLREKIEEYQHRIRVFHALIPHTFQTSLSQEEDGRMDNAYELRTFADSLSMLLQDDDEQLDNSYINTSQLDTSVEEENDDNRIIDSRRRGVLPSASPERLTNRGQQLARSMEVSPPNSASDAERLRRLRGLTSLADSPVSSPERVNSSYGRNRNGEEKSSRYHK